MIIFEGLAYVTTWILLVFGSGVQLMQFMQVAYGIATVRQKSFPYLKLVFITFCPYFRQLKYLTILTSMLKLIRTSIKW